MQNRQWSSNSSSGGSISVIPEHHSEITATQRSPVIDCEADTDREEEDTPIHSAAVEIALEVEHPLSLQTVVCPVLKTWFLTGIAHCTII